VSPTAPLAFLTEHEYAVVAVCADVLLPPHGEFAGGAAAGVADYVDLTLGAFTFDPPRVWAGGPYSGRFGGDASFTEFLPLSRLEELAWRTRIEGSRGIAEREWNGPLRGWQQIYREGIGALGERFLDLDDSARFDAVGAVPELKSLLFEHACEACYGAPEYGGNRELTGWRSIGYAGDVQPRGWSDAEVTGA
jgi:Gluconate 2-dehydrogenase subunit 3